MSRATPLVYVAPSAQVRARQIIPGCVENEVAAAINAGSLRFDAGVATISGDGWQVVATRGPGVLRKTPRCWRVTEVSRTHRVPRREE